MSNVAYIDMVHDFSAAITTNGDLYTWGINEYGQLGNGTTDETCVPTKILSNVASVSLGNSHSAAITANGDLYTRGDNRDGELGNGTNRDSLLPVKVMSNAAAVDVGDCYSAAITVNGDLYTWGVNSNAQLGNGTLNDSSVPVKIMSNAASVSVGWGHGAVINKSGELYTWGYNCYGQIGNGTTELTLSPTKIMSGVAAVELGASFSSAITTSGNLYTWGCNGSNELGDGTDTERYTPVRIMSGVASVSLGTLHSAATDIFGNLYTWGLNCNGQLGNGVVDGENNVSVPTRIDAFNGGSKPIGPRITKTVPGDGQVALNWTNVIGAKQYAVYYRAGNTWTLAGKTTSVGMYVRGLTNGSKYGFAVKAYLNGTWSNITSVDIVYATPAALTVKPKITRTIPGNGQVGLNWSSVSGAKQYAVYYRAGSTWTLAGKTTTLGMYVRGLTNGAKYGFAVKAYINGSWTSISSSDIVYATPAAPVAKPVITKAAPGSGQVALNWTSVSGAKQYAVYTYVNGKWTLAGKTTALGMYVRNLTNGTKYGFAVKAYVNGTWSAITSADIVYATPTAAKSALIEDFSEDIEFFGITPVIA